jgi:putative membrane protein insertion efficiency factor
MTRNVDVIKVGKGFSWRRHIGFLRLVLHSLSSLGKISACWERNRMSHRGALWTTAWRAPSVFGRAMVKAYRYTLSPLIGFRCRYLPTCSEFADEALERHGLWAGGWMTLARILRCHPLGSSGLDLVPADLPGRSRWYLPWRYGKWSWARAQANGQDG